MISEEMLIAHITQQNDENNNNNSSKKQACFTLLGNRDDVYQARTRVETMQHNINDQITTYQSTMYDISEYIDNTRTWIQSLTLKEMIMLLFQSFMFLIKLIVL